MITYTHSCERRTKSPYRQYGPSDEVQKVDPLELTVWRSASRWDLTRIHIGRRKWSIGIPRAAGGLTRLCYFPALLETIF